MADSTANAGIKSTFRTLLLTCILLCMGACGVLDSDRENTTSSVFYHDGELIRLTHDSRQELAIQGSIDTDLDVGVGSTSGLGYASPVLIWVNKTRSGCPGNTGADCAFHGDPPPNQGDWKRCEIYSDPNGRRLTPGFVDVPGFPLESSFRGYCYAGISANATQSTVAAVITAMSNSGDTVVQGELMVKEGSAWRSPSYPGKAPENRVFDTAVNNAGTLVGYTLGGSARILDLATDQVTNCIGGDQVAFGKWDNDPAIAASGGNTIRIALVSNCGVPVRTTTVSGTDARIVSMDWNEFSREVVYIKQVGDTYSIHEYVPPTNSHSQVISDRRVKHSISVLR